MTYFMDNVRISFLLLTLSPNCCYMSLTGRLELLHLLGQISWLFPFSLISLFKLVLRMLDRYRTFYLACALLSLEKFIYYFKGNAYSEPNYNFEQVWLYKLNQALGGDSSETLDQLLSFVLEMHLLPFSMKDNLSKVLFCSAISPFHFRWVWCKSPKDEAMRL